jgi:hypothetical protein
MLLTQADEQPHGRVSVCMILYITSVWCVMTDLSLQYVQAHLQYTDTYVLVSRCEDRD